MSRGKKTMDQEIQEGSCLLMLIMAGVGVVSVAAVAYESMFVPKDPTFNERIIKANEQMREQNRRNLEAMDLHGDCMEAIGDVSLEQWSLEWQECERLSDLVRRGVE